MAKREPSSGAQPKRRNLGRLLYVPVPLRKHILEELHSTSYSGHLGVDKTTAAIQRRFWWPHPYGDDWDQRIGDLDFAYNNSEQRSTGQTPFFLLHGFHPRVPVDLIEWITEDKLAAKLRLPRQVRIHR